MPAETQIFLCLKDNYGVLLHDPVSGETAAIDAPEAGPVDAALKETGWRLTDILVTHHHNDHTAGIEPLSAAWRAHSGHSLLRTAPWIHERRHTSAGSRPRSKSRRRTWSS